MIILDLRKYKTVSAKNSEFKLEDELKKLIDQVRGATQIIYDLPDYVIVYKDQYKYLKHKVKLPPKTKYAIYKNE